VFVVCGACSGLCDGLITPSEEPYRGYVSNYVRSRNIKNEAAEAPARLLRHRKEKSSGIKLFLRYGDFGGRTLEGNVNKLLNEECRSWFSLIEYEISKACGTQAMGQFLKYVVGKLTNYNL
jgi:hypothetical protein